jgi:predicted GNAT superfamily acetyltransferase
MAASQAVGQIDLRHLTQLPDLREAVRLQQQIWGFEDIELLPLRLFVVATKVGGQVIGAFDGGRMVAFLLAIPGIKPGGRYYLHSHMMGVLEGYRDSGIGRRLKLLQRQEALARGITLTEWTFDPLELKNAWFNIERLGAVVRRYILNQYGTTTSHLHGGLPTDRCVAEWYLAGPRVAAITAGQIYGRGPIAARVTLPNDIAAIRANQPKRAREIQQRVSESFLENINQGRAVVGFERAADESSYLFGQWERE